MILLYNQLVMFMLTVKVRLRPTPEQEQLFWWYSKVARNYYNLLVAIDKANNMGKYDDLLTGWETYHSDYYGRNICRLSQQDYMDLAKYEATEQALGWFNKPNQSFIYSSVARELIAIRRRNKGRLRFRCIDNTMPRFAVRCDEFSNGKRESRIYKVGKYLTIPSIGKVRYSTSHLPIDLDCKKQAACVVFDGKYWFLDFTCNCTRVYKKQEYTEPIGVDLGIKTLATVSDGRKFGGIRYLRRYKILTKRLKRLQRKLSRKYLINKATKQTKSNNIKKLERQIRLIYRSLKNLRLNYIRELVVAITKTNPKSIAIEDLNVKGMLKNKHLAREIANASFYTIREALTRRCEERGIQLKIVDRFYPSSKLCSNCGHKKNDLKLSERTYVCSNCNMMIDRDLNAAINLVKASV